MPRVHKVNAARKDYPQFGIKKGDSYYHWSFRYGPEMKSKTYPTRSQLTGSGFLKDLYDLEDNLEFDREDLENSVSEVCDRIQELIDQCQDSLDNMPEALQESSDSGMLLQERIEALESWMSDLEGVDTDVDEVEDIELDLDEQAEVEAIGVDDLTAEDYAAMPEGLEGHELEAAIMAAVDAKREARALELKEAKREERIEDIINELTGFGPGL